MTRQLTCRCSFKFRWFHSKGVALILVWILLTALGGRVMYQLLFEFTSRSTLQKLILEFTSMPACISAPFFGWLADAKLGNYKVLKIGIRVSLIASVLTSVLELLHYNTPFGEDQNLVIETIFLALTNLFMWTSAFIFLTNSFQLSLEQIPDASAENITSLISWFILSICTGLWAGDVIKDLLLACISKNDTNWLKQTLTLLPVICTSINFVSFHLISPKWLIIEPNSKQSLKNIYRVLKFAAKHKAPLNRSALTYWEEDIPSRLDLGKSRYGGPFTTEQVEDVKTFFKILAVSVAIFLMMIVTGFDTTFNISPCTVFNNTHLSTCEANGLFLFTLHPWWCRMLTVMLYEFLIYPCLNIRLPSSMKRIGFASFAVVLRNIMLLIVRVLMYFNIVETDALWVKVINLVLCNLLMVAIGIPWLEFVCAQAPYNMRGLLTGYTHLMYGLAFILGFTVTVYLTQYCLAHWCLIANSSVGAAVSIFAFLFYVIIAHRYKKRKRDDIDTPHQWVEEVYDRYLSAVNYR